MEPKSSDSSEIADEAAVREARKGKKSDAQKLKSLQLEIKDFLQTLKNSGLPAYRCYLRLYEYLYTHTSVGRPSSSMGFKLLGMGSYSSATKAINQFWEDAAEMHRASQQSIYDEFGVRMVDPVIANSNEKTIKNLTLDTAPVIPVDKQVEFYQAILQQKDEALKHLNTQLKEQQAELLYFKNNLKEIIADLRKEAEDDDSDVRAKEILKREREFSAKDSSILKKPQKIQDVFQDDIQKHPEDDG